MGTLRTRVCGSVYVCVCERLLLASGYTCLKKGTRSMAAPPRPPPRPTNTPRRDPPAGGCDCHDNLCMNHCPFSCRLISVDGGEPDGSFAATRPGPFEPPNAFDGRDRKTTEDSRWCQLQLRKRSLRLLIDSKHKSNLIPQVYV